MTRLQAKEIWTANTTEADRGKGGRILPWSPEGAQPGDI